MYAVIDLETTGGSYRSERITEIAIFIFDGEKVTDRYQTLINPEKRIPHFVSQLTGITDKMLERAPRFYEVARDIVEITQDKIIVAHNASFDYGFIRSEFKRLGYNYERKKICTVKLARKLIPGKKHYSLGKLCKELGIRVNSRHRAAGDAEATLKLFQYLLTFDPHPEEISLRGLNSNLDKDIIDKLPEEPGVYYFLDENEKVIYIGKSNNIHERILSHLSNNNTKRAIEMKSQIADIHYELTGSDLIASLLESNEIKKHMPIFNRAQRRTAKSFGLYSYTDENGYLQLSIESTQNKKAPIRMYSSMKSAREHLMRLCEEYTLCQKLCNIYKTKNACFHYGIGQCNGACIGEESPEAYNIRVSTAIDSFSYDHKSFLLIDRGRTDNERAVVKVESGCYMGFGYADVNMINGNLELLKECVKRYDNNRDAQAIIKKYMRRKKVEQIITF
ncbi:MAG: GIY-YIG nuclease family protein [Bacteroidales bacterium]|nr:GIY-YIG nuclease family protein [Bacteroidales bacterium]